MAATKQPQCQHCTVYTHIHTSYTHKTLGLCSTMAWRVQLSRTRNGCFNKHIPCIYAPAARPWPRTCAVVPLIMVIER